jgi:hypothetical protein
VPSLQRLKGVVPVVAMLEPETVVVPMVVISMGSRV